MTGGTGRVLGRVGHVCGSGMSGGELFLLDDRTKLHKDVKVVPVGRRVARAGTRSARAPRRDEVRRGDRHAERLRSPHAPRLARDLARSGWLK
jgi:glutamate synthase domain-containing protein 3